MLGNIGLMLACLGGWRRCALMLLAEGASPVAHSSGASALHLAAGGMRLQVVGNADIGVIDLHI